MHQVLEEVGVADSKKLLVLNKADLLDSEQRQALREEFPDAMMTSARSADDVSQLHKYIIGVAQEEMIEEEIIIPYNAKGIVGEIRSSMSVTKEEYEYEYIKLTVRSSAINLARLKKRMLSL